MEIVEKVATFKVANGSDARKLAGCISHVLKGDNGQEKMDKVELVCIGAAAVNQAIKAVTISSGHARLINKELLITTSFTTITFDGEERTGIKITAFFKN